MKWLNRRADLFSCIEDPWFGAIMLSFALASSSGMLRHRLNPWPRARQTCSGLRDSHAQLHGVTGNVVLHTGQVLWAACRHAVVALYSGRKCCVTACVWHAVGTTLFMPYNMSASQTHGTAYHLSFYLGL